MARLVALVDRAVLRVAGEGSSRFLQGLCTQDMQRLPEHTAPLREVCQPEILLKLLVSIQNASFRLRRCSQRPSCRRKASCSATR